jgi:hypothetical protein
MWPCSRVLVCVGTPNDSNNNNNNISGGVKDRPAKRQRFKKIPRTLSPLPTCNSCVRIDGRTIPSVPWWICKPGTPTYCPILKKEESSIGMDRWMGDDGDDSDASYKQAQAQVYCIASRPLSLSLSHTHTPLSLLCIACLPTRLNRSHYTSLLLHLSHMHVR